MAHKARKRFGQNFLQDSHIINAIVQSINPKSDECLIEIGPGLGALTFPVLAAAKRLIAIEIDNDCITYLQSQSLPDEAQLQIISGDALGLDIAQVSAQTQARIIGNLPYNISTPLLMHLFKQQAWIQDMHFMLQKEVVQRLVSSPGTKSYGRLSVVAQYYCQVTHLFDVPPQAFHPQPKVDSAIVRLVPHRNICDVADDVDYFSTIVKQAFSQRRKTVKNNLKALISADDLCAIEIDPTARPEQLDVAAFVRLSNHLNKLRT